MRETTAREVGGRPLALPMVDIHTVGAGGGSIAWRDPGGALRVGPRSAGAEPGPACYGRGGTEPTVTDANLVLGHLERRRRRWPATSTLDADAAHARRRAPGRRRSASTRAACAEGIVRVANAEMVRALRVMTVERGIDPRRFALLAFGGAGPLHAAAIAEELGMTKILVPRASGVLSALGLAAADRRADAQRTVLGGDDDASRRRAARRGRRGAGRRAGDRGRLGPALPRPVARADRPRRASATSCASASRRCTRSATATATPTARSSSSPSASPAACPPRRSTSARPPASRSSGPTVVALPEATLVVPEGWSGSTDDTGTLVLERAA